MTSVQISTSEATSIEAYYHQTPLKRNAPIALIAPPHPEREGSMTHKVIYVLYRAFASAGFNVLRFNYRGCGQSIGTFTNGEGEIADAAACLDWLNIQNSTASQCWVAGFSFGAWVSMQLLMRRPECHHFIAISPPANLYDFSFLAPCPAPGLIVHSDGDEVTPKDSVIRLVHHLSMQRKGQKIEFRCLENTDHHYTDALRPLEALLVSYITQNIQGLVSPSSHAV